MEQFSDTKLIELAQAGDQAAFAELYGRYFDPVYDFVARMTRNRDEAADIAQDTFLKAMNALGGLQKGASFKSWIFTIARNTALNRLERNKRTRPLTFEDEEGGEVSFDVVDTDRFADPAEAAEAEAMGSLVWRAAAGLDPKQFSLLDLHLRQGLDSGEIADVLGVTKNNGYVMLNRLKKAVEEAIGAFIMLHDGRRSCEALDLALSRAGIAEMTPEVRKLVDRHVAQCPECEERKRKLVAPLAVFGAFAMAGPPAGLKPQILEGLMRQWPGPASGGGDGADPATRGAARGSRGTAWSSQPLLKAVAGLGLAAVLLLGAVFIPVSPLAITKHDGSERIIPAAGGDDTPGTTANSNGGTDPSGTSAPLAGGPGGSPSPSPTPPASPSPPPGATASATSTSEALDGDGLATNTVTSPPPGGGGTPTPPPATQTPTGTATPTATATPVTRTPTPTPSPTKTQAPCNPSLSVQVLQLAMSPGETRSFPLFNTELCGPASFLAAGGASWLEVSPVQGTIPAYRDVTITVMVNAVSLPGGEGTYSANIQIDGPNNSVVIPVTVTRGGEPPSLSLLRKSCGLTAPTLSLYLAAMDDIGVTSVVVSYTRSDGSSGQVNATHDGGSNWSVTGLLGARAFSAVAYDGAGHASAAVTGSC